MTGRERFLRALSLREPDAVPTWVHGMNEASIIRIGRHFVDGLPEIKPVHHMSPAELMQVAEGLMRIHEELEIDGITAVPLEEEEPLGGGRFRNEWGIVKEHSPHGLPVPVGHPVTSAAELAAYRPPAPEPHRAGLVAQLMRARFGDEKAVVHMVRGVFTNAWYLSGMERLLKAMIREPAFVEGLHRIVTDYCRQLIELARSVGADAVVLDDDLADKHNPMMSPRHFARFVAPYHRELVEHAHALGLKIILHSDGNLWPLLERIAELGFDGLNPLEPEAGMELGRVKQAVGERICLLGNIDCGELLCHAPVAEVEAAVRAAIDVAAQGGGYILCDSNSIHPGVRPESFIAMMRTAKRHNPYGACAATA